jgi:hypothetical protein
MKYMVLWIEDEAYDIAARYAGPVLASGLYDLDIATSVDDGAKNLIAAEERNTPYDVIVIDIRFGPSMVRSGFGLLSALLQAANRKEEFSQLPTRYGRSHIGVLTVETERELEAELQEIGVTHYRCKERRAGARPLIELIEEIVKEQRDATAAH